MGRRRILCLAGYFLPGFKGGGPIRSLKNLSDWLDGDFEVYVLTRNHDLGDHKPYSNKQAGRWYQEGHTRVQYLSGWLRRPWQIRHAIEDVQPHLLYCQSFFDPVMTFLPLLLRRLHFISRRLPVLVAPRGEFSPGAIGLKRARKRIFIRVARWLGTYADVAWHATGEDEAQLIQNLLGHQDRIYCAPNLPPRFDLMEPRTRVKIPGRLHLAWLSRISPKKNLLGALDVLCRVKRQVSLDIFGTIEDETYWDRCMTVMRRLPKNVAVNFRGALEPHSVVATLKEYDGFLFLTLGENFGHVILEALTAGCPIIVSDQTPWTNLEARQCGVDLPLDRPTDIATFIDRLADMGADEHERWVRGAEALASAYRNQPDLISPTQKMLLAVSSTADG